MEFINLTPHSVVIRVPDQQSNTDSDATCDIKILPSGQVARISVEMQTINREAGIPIFSRVFGSVENLPNRRDGVGYIVSTMVFDRFPDRLDLFCPDSGPSAFRAPNGQVEAVRGLIGRTET